MLRVFVGVTSVIAMLGVATTTLGVTCGAAPTDSRFLAVCGLQRRAVDFDELWEADRSGVYVRWTDAYSAPHVGIVTARHYLDTGTTSHGVFVQQDNWYAYFSMPDCTTYTFSGPCYPLCIGSNEDLIRVRIKRFMLPVEEYFEWSSGVRDGVIVGEIEPDDVCFLDHITPIELIMAPMDLGVCRDQSVYIAGWGDDCNGSARALNVAATTISSINCESDGRKGDLLIPGGSCGETNCVPALGEHDSGGAVFIEQEESLVLVGTIRTYTTAFITIRHQYFSDPESSDHLCQPCRPRGCVDLTSLGHDESLGPPDMLEDQVDQDTLELCGPVEVNCGCMGDLNHNGVAGDSGDLAIMDDRKFGVPCPRNRGCYGDAKMSTAM